MSDGSSGLRSIPALLLLKSLVLAGEATDHRNRALWRPVDQPLAVIGGLGVRVEQRHLRLRDLVSATGDPERQRVDAGHDRPAVTELGRSRVTGEGGGRLLPRLAFVAAQLVVLLGVPDTGRHVATVRTRLARNRSDQKPIARRSLRLP